MDIPRHVATVGHVSPEHFIRDYTFPCIFRAMFNSWKRWASAETFARTQNGVSL